MLKKMFLAIVMMAFSSGFVVADIVADVGAGPGTSITVASGTALTVKMLYLPSIASTVAFDGVGLDLNWTPTGSAAAALAGPFPGFLLAGTATGATLADDLFLPTVPGAVTPGTPLFNPGVAPSAGTFSIGGGAHFDFSGGALTGGPSYGVPSGSAPLDLMGADFIVTGSFGDTITFTPSGILMGGAAYPAGPTMSGGVHYYTNTAVGSGMGTASPLPELIIGSVTVTIVPEPGTSMLLCGLVGIGFYRRRSRAG